MFRNVQMSPATAKSRKNEYGADYLRSSHSVCNSSPKIVSEKITLSHHWRKSGPENSRNTEKKYPFHFLCVFNLPLTAPLSFSTSDENQCQIQIRNADTRQIQDKWPFHFPPCRPFTSELLAFKYETQDRHSLGPVPVFFQMLDIWDTCRSKYMFLLTSNPFLELSLIFNGPSTVWLFWNKYHIDGFNNDIKGFVNSNAQSVRL